MSKLERYFKQVEDWEKEQTDPTNWEQHLAPAETVEDFAHKILNNDPDTRDKNGYLTLENILASSCVSISDTYRSGAPTDHLKKIEDMMQHYKTNAPIVLYRGVSEVPYEKMVKAAKQLGESGTDFYELGYMSCSLLQEKASPYKVQLVIYCPPFSNIIYLGHCNDHEEYECRYECIINRSARLQIVKQENNTYYCILRGTKSTT